MSSQPAIPVKKQKLLPGTNSYLSLILIGFIPIAIAMSAFADGEYGASAITVFITLLIEFWLFKTIRRSRSSQSRLREPQGLFGRSQPETVRSGRPDESDAEPVTGADANELPVSHSRRGIIFCWGCGGKVHQSAISCPHCGAPQKSTEVFKPTEKEALGFFRRSVSGKEAILAIFLF
jgi:hypothetical protein